MTPTFKTSALKSTNTSHLRNKWNGPQMYLSWVWRGVQVPWIRHSPQQQLIVAAGAVAPDRVRIGDQLDTQLRIEHLLMRERCQLMRCRGEPRGQEGVKRGGPPGPSGSVPEEWCQLMHSKNRTVPH